MEPFVTLLDKHCFDFPPIQQALKDPNGLLALGGDLSPKRLLKAYQNGIFPWFQPGEPILWWSPEPRCVLYPNDLHISKSFRKSLRKTHFNASINQAFEPVMRLCGDLRAHKEGTWISNEMIEAYCELHTLGYAHSIEIWEKEELVGGLYGIAMAPCFFGESMFSLRPNASKMAMAVLCNFARSNAYDIIDCQVENDHLLSMGARCISRDQFLSFLNGLDVAPDKRWSQPLTALSQLVT